MEEEGVALRWVVAVEGCFVLGRRGIELDLHGWKRYVVDFA